jgi:hypothetical protein
MWEWDIRVLDIEGSDSAEDGPRRARLWRQKPTALEVLVRMRIDSAS